jgi:hypothetical protein
MFDLVMSKDQEPEEIDPAHLPAVLEGLAQAKRRQFATDAEVEAAFRRFDDKKQINPPCGIGRTGLEPSQNRTGII